MRKSCVIWLLIVGNILGGCANEKTRPPPATSLKLRALQQQSDLAAHYADQCIEQATERTGNQLKQLIAAGNDPAPAALRLVLDQGDAAIAKCHEDEAIAQAQAAAQERAEYLREEQAERSRAALMATLSGSLGH